MKNGFLLIDKPKGMTSRDVVNLICKKLNTKKVGHTGTLDPIATGLMILCINKATSLNELITSEDKEYVATVKLGIKTDTLDITGNIIEENETIEVDYNELANCLKSFIGSYMQEVPLYSAVKVNGRRLYDYARKNENVELPQKKVTINDIELLELNGDSFKFRVSVSKGTYIRSLIRDISLKMDVLMTMSDLRRIKINEHDISSAKKIDDISENDIILVDDFLNLKKIVVDKTLEKKIINGVRIKNIYDSEMVMFYNENNRLLAIYKENNQNELCMFKLF